MNIQINEPGENDEGELESLFLLTITHTFKLNKINDPEDMLQEVKHQMNTWEY